MCIKERSRPGQGNGIAAKGQIKFTEKEFEIKYSVAMVGGYAVLGIEWHTFKGYTVLDDPKGINDPQYVKDSAYEFAKNWILKEAQKYTRFNLKSGKP